LRIGAVLRDYPRKARGQVCRFSLGIDAPIVTARLLVAVKVQPAAITILYLYTTITCPTCPILPLMGRTERQKSAIRAIAGLKCLGLLLPIAEKMAAISTSAERSPQESGGCGGILATFAISEPGPGIGHWRAFPAHAVTARLALLPRHVVCGVLSLFCHRSAYVPCTPHKLRPSLGLRPLPFGFSSFLPLGHF